MNLLELKLGAQRYRGGGGGGGGGGDGGDSGDSSGIGDGIGPSAGPGAGPGAPGTGPSSNGDVGEGNDSPGAAGVDSDVAAVVADMASNPSVSSNNNGIAGMMGIDNPTLASVVNGIIGMGVTAAIGPIGGMAVGLGNAAISGNPSAAAATMGSGIASAAGIPGGIGAAIGSAIGNMGGVPASSVASDPNGGTDRDWTATPVRTPGSGTLSGGLGMGSTGNAQPATGVQALRALGGIDPNFLASLQTPKRAGDVRGDNPLVAALRGDTPTMYSL